MAVGGARGSPVNLSQGRGPFVQQMFYLPVRLPARFVLTGVTKDSTGAPLGSVVIDFFDSVAKTLIASTISDSAGSYTVDLPASAVVQGVAYKAGAPDVAGVTVNTLTPVPA